MRSAAVRRSWKQSMRPMATARLVAALSRLRPATDYTDPGAAVKLALRSLARRHAALTEEIDSLEAALAELTERAAPGLLSKLGVGVQVAAQLLMTAGDNPERLRSEASFAHLTGAAPIPASSGQTRRHRLNRGATAKPTTRCTRSRSSGCATTRRPARTRPDAPPRACRSRTSCAASSGTSPARSTTSSPTRHDSPPPLDIYRSIP